MQGGAQRRGGHRPPDAASPPVRLRVDEHRGDNLDEEDGVLTVGALAVAGPKMKLPKACIRTMFESKGTVLDLEGVYDVALEAL